jgi:hypothetical protein
MAKTGGTIANPADLGYNNITSPHSERERSLTHNQDRGDVAMLYDKRLRDSLGCDHYGLDTGVSEGMQKLFKRIMFSMTWLTIITWLAIVFTSHPMKSKLVATLGAVALFVLLSRLDDVLKEGGAYGAWGCCGQSVVSRRKLITSLLTSLAGIAVGGAVAMVLLFVVAVALAVFLLFICAGIALVMNALS